MPIYKGSQAIGAIYKGSTAIARVYKGSDLVWQASAGGNAGRYLLIKFPSPTNLVQAYEIEVYESYGGSNVALGKTATASSVASGAAANAVDGNTGTLWSTGSTSPPTGGHWFKLDAGAGNTFSPLLIGFNPSSLTEAPRALTASLSNDDLTYTEIMNFPSVELPRVGSQRRLFGTDGDETGGYRYHWLKQTGNNFAGASQSYIREIKFNNANHNCALENITLGGTAGDMGYAFGADAGMAYSIIGWTYGVDHGKKRVLTSVTLDFSTISLYAQHGLKQWELYGSNVAIGDAGGTLLKSVNDTSGTPAASESRTYTI